MNERLRRLCGLLGEQGIDAALLLHPRDVLYYAGTARPASLLVICGLCAPSPSRPTAVGQAVLLVRRGLRYAAAEATIDRVKRMRGFSTVQAATSALGLHGARLGAALDVIPAGLYLRLKGVFPQWELVDISSLILNQRMVKDSGEVEATRQAARAADAGHRALPQTAAPGVTELELAAYVEQATRRAGHEGYQPLRHPEARGGGALLMSGENLAVRGGHGLVVTGTGLSAASPYGASRRVLQEGDIIVLDIGTTCGGYTADESRTFVVGRPQREQQALFDVTRQTEDAVIGCLRPGVPVAEIYATAEAIVDRGAPPVYDPGSLTLPGFVGHGIGLELDEPPVLWPRDRTVLREGMVLAVEVEISAGERAIMTKLEDTVVIRSDGCEVLTNAPRTLVQCR